VGPEFFHACRWTDRHDKAKSRFMQFRERAQKLCNSECFKIVCYCSLNLHIPFRKEPKTLVLQYQVISSDSRMSAVGEFVIKTTLSAICLSCPCAARAILLSGTDFYPSTTSIATCWQNVTQWWHVTSIKTARRASPSFLQLASCLTTDRIVIVSYSVIFIAALRWERLFVFVTAAITQTIQHGLSQNLRCLPLCPWLQSPIYLCLLTT